MAALHGDRIPYHLWIVPVLGLLGWAGIGKGGGLIAGLLLAALLIGSVLAAVHHAELVALRLGEPYGTLVLTLSMTIIEIAMLVSLMLTGEPNPFLVRDAVQAVVILVVHGIAGACIVIGALRHREPEFSTAGASAFLAVLMPMVALVLILPNHTLTTLGPYYSNRQLAFVAVACLALYLVFLFVQTVRHREYFLPAVADRRPAGEASAPPARIAGIAGMLLVLSLTAVVLLAKSLAPSIEAGIAAIGAPIRLTGVVAAAIVLMPETGAAIGAARSDRLQTSINLALGGAVACIGLTIPSVVAISLWLNLPLALGVDSGGTVLLVLSFLMAMLTYGQGRTNLLAGFVHLVLLACYVFLIFEP